MIRRIWFPTFVAESLGLVPLERPLERLGKMVVLAGPNGSGKSRTLQVMQHTLGHLRFGAGGIAQLSQQLEAHRSSLARFDTDLSIEPERREHLRSRHVQAIQGCENRIRDLERALIEAEIVGEVSPERIATLTYEMEQQHVVAVQSLTPTAAADYISGNRTAGFVGAYRSMPAYFQRIARALWHAVDPQVKEHPSSIERASEASSFNDILHALMNGRVEPSLNENQEIVAKFRGREFNYKELSSGEAVLVTWAIILHRQGKALSNAIVVIDEPENHLHPDACIKALTTLRDQILVGPHSQIWLATHSVQLIAFAGIDAICLVEGGRIEYAGNKVDAVIKSLLGGHDGREQLRAFLDGADALGFYKFAAECLLSPSVASKLGDPQEAQLVTQVRSRIGGSEPLRLLDFGAGKGRLAAALREALANFQVPDGTVNLSYCAYNGAHSSDWEREECRARVAELGSTPGVRARYVDHLGELQLEAAPKADIVVLCNVLHEVRVDRWLVMFNDISRVLSPLGSLIVMEDQTMRVGELPNAHGFVVLDAIELAALFGTTPGNGVRSLPSARAGRLTQVEVSAEFIKNANVERLRQALEGVCKRASDEVELLRADSAYTFQMGQRHAYYSMLYMNAALALRTFGGVHGGAESR